MTTTTSTTSTTDSAVTLTASELAALRYADIRHATLSLQGDGEAWDGERAGAVLLRKAGPKSTLDVWHLDGSIIAVADGWACDVTLSPGELITLRMVPMNGGAATIETFSDLDEYRRVTVEAANSCDGYGQWCLNNDITPEEEGVLEIAEEYLAHDLRAYEVTEYSLSTLGGERLDTYQVSA